MSNFKGIHNPSYRHGCNVRGNLHPLYVVWTNMKARCGHTKLSDNRVKRYYKSISVYKEWLDFAMFLAWAEPRWKPGLEIDRKDSKGDYCPENCRFVTRTENMQNTRLSKWWMIGGLKFKSRADAANRLNLSPMKITMICNGYKSRGVFYPPKPGCYSVLKYTGWY